MHMDLVDMPSKVVSVIATADFDLGAADSAGGWVPVIQVAVTVPGSAFGPDRHVVTETVAKLDSVHVREADAADAATAHAVDRLRSLFA